MIEKLITIAMAQMSLLESEKDTYSVNCLLMTLNQLKKCLKDAEKPDETQGSSSISSSETSQPNSVESEGKKK